MDTQVRGLGAVLADLADELYDCRGRRRGAVILAPGRLEEAEGYEVLVLAPTTGASHACAARVAERLAGMSPQVTSRRSTGELRTV